MYGRTRVFLPEYSIKGSENLNSVEWNCDDDCDELVAKRDQMGKPPAFTNSEYDVETSVMHVIHVMQHKH